MTRSSSRSWAGVRQYKIDLPDAEDALERLALGGRQYYRGVCFQQTQKSSTGAAIPQP